MKKIENNLEFDYVRQNMSGDTRQMRCACIC